MPDLPSSPSSFCRLDVYRTALEFVAVANEVAQELPRGRSHLGEQLHRASSSIPLNIAEGAEEYRLPEKARFYRMARRSATECVAILDICETLSLAPLPPLTRGRDLLTRVVSMLVALVIRLETPQAPKPPRKDG